MLMTFLSYVRGRESTTNKERIVFTVYSYAAFFLALFAKETAVMAKKWGVRIHTHICETLDEETYCLEKHRMRPVDYRVLEAAQHGLPRIGHFGFFKPQGETALWPLAADWLDRAAG